MKKATYTIEDGRVILTLPDKRKAHLPHHFSLPDGESSGDCEYLLKKKIFHVSFRSTNMLTFQESDIEFIDPPKVRKRAEEEEEARIQKAAIEQAQKAAEDDIISNQQPALENGKVKFFAEQIANIDQALLKSYSDAAKDAWALVRLHTLGPAISFFDYQKTKTNDLAPVYQLIYDHLAAWFTEDACMLPNKPSVKVSLLSFLTEEINSETYRAYTREALSCLQWTARLAEAESKN